MYPSGALFGTEQCLGNATISGLRKVWLVVHRGGAMDNLLLTQAPNQAYSCNGRDEIRLEFRHLWILDYGMTIDRRHCCFDDVVLFHHFVRRLPN